jgi:uncharacterized membrane protein YraQ (UPF0718 family)
MTHYLQNLFIFTLAVAPYMLGGLLIAGFIHSFISISFIKKQLGKRGFFSVVKAALIGVPLPLCSCSVIPTAITFKKAGASNGATSSFLISTPESGVDSIAVTFSLMDLPMTILRPLAAFFSAIFAGILQDLFNVNGGEELKEEVKSCCSSKDKKSEDSSSLSFKHRIIKGLKYAYVDLFDDIAFWVFLGLTVGALIQTALPDNMLEAVSGPYSRILLLLIGVPIYVCASSTTPMAVSMILKGLSPGSALILLLVGPATNISNMLVLQKYIGKKGVFINVFSISFVALLMSYFVDYLYTKMAWSIHDYKILGMNHYQNEILLFDIVIVSVFSLMIFKGIFLKEIRPRLIK